MTRTEWLKFVYDNDVFDAYQYIDNTKKTLDIVCYCKELIKKLLSKMENDNNRCRTDIFERFLGHSGPIKSATLNVKDFPTYSTTICGIEVNAVFLLEKLIKDFYQYVRNAFDCMSQTANASILGTKAEEIEKVDFNHMKKIFKENKEYIKMFPNISSWYSKIGESKEYKYINAFNNRTKHICDVNLKFSMSIIGNGDVSEINPFFKNKQRYDKKDIMDCIEWVFDFVSKVYSEFMTVLRIEVTKKIFVKNRFHNIVKTLRTSDADIAIIIDDKSFHDKPEMIELLPVDNMNGIMEGHNSTFEMVYICAPNQEDSYISYKVVNDVCQDDFLLKYRRYRRFK